MGKSHTIEGVFFLIRFMILYTGLSAASTSASTVQPVIKMFLSFILLFELVGSLSILLANILYKCMVYAERVLYERDDDDLPYCPRKSFWRLSTLTCFTCDCYYEHPYAVLLTRISILGAGIFLRFIAFILGVTCANRYPPWAIGYTVVTAVSFLPSIATMILEYCHHRRLRRYFPDGDSQGQRSPKHRQFMPYSIINDQRTSSWRSSLCQRSSCTSRNLYHILLHHSGSTQYPDNNGTMIGFHQTDHQSAFHISRTGFRVSERGMLGPGVYFATCIEHTEFKAHHRDAYICARVNVGKIERTTDRNAHRNAEINCDTLYFKHALGSDEFCVRNPDRIEEWIIVVNQDESIRRAITSSRDNLKDHFYGEAYTGCIY
jgi:hypothetical protein